MFENEYIRQYVEEFVNMTDEIFNVMECFPNSFINRNGEVILSEKGNVYFNAMDCTDKSDITCKLFEWCSRPIVKGVAYSSAKRNREWQEDLLNGLNRYLGTQFSLEDVYYIYQELGNGVDHDHTMEFVNSGFDFDVIYNKFPDKEEVTCLEEIEI